MLWNPIEQRGGLPESIVADPRDLMSGAYAPWELGYDSVATMKRVEAHCLVQRLIHVSDVVRVGRRPHHTHSQEYLEEKHRERRRAIEQAADRFVEGAPWAHERAGDWRFREDVLAEVAERLREAIADPFLLEAVRGRS